MSTATDKAISLSEVTAFLNAPQMRDGKTRYKCPACGEFHLDVSQKNDKVLVKCWTDSCQKGAAWAKLKAALRPANTTSEADDEGLTLADYCKMKGLPELGLRWVFDAGETTYKGKPAVTFPYFDIAGNLTGTRIRLANKKLWTRGAKAKETLYGLWKYSHYPVDGQWARDLVICEGESDVQTLFLYDIAALGVPGAECWNEAHAQLPIIQNAERIFIVHEPGTGGDRFVAAVSQSLPRGKAFALKFPAKDPSALHIESPSDPAEITPARAARRLANGMVVDAQKEMVVVPAIKSAFIQAFDAAIAAATPIGAEEGAPAVNRRFNYTDSGNAEMLVALHGENFRWLTDEEVFCFWNGSKWEKNKSGNILLPITKEVARAIPDPDWKLTSESAGKRQAMIAMARGEKQVLAKRDLFDQRTMLLNVQNGTLDLETQDFRDFCREDYLTKQAPVMFDFTAGCPKFEAFLDRIFDGDKDMIHFIVKALGYSLTGSAKEQCFFFCYGTGANGKSTLFEVFRLLVGADYAGTAGFSTFVEKKHQDASGYDIATLPGRRMITTVEPQKSGRLNEELLKLMTGDEVIKTRQIYGVPFDFKPECKLWFAMNQHPRIAGQDEGIWRRVRLIPFSVQIPPAERIQGYQEILWREEGPGILNLLLEGVRDWLAEGLTPPSAVTKATEAFRAEQDVLARFLEEHTLRGKRSQHVKAGDLYSAYQRWAEANGEYPQRLNEFFAEVARRGAVKRRTTNDGFHYFGLTLKSSPTEDPDLFAAADTEET